MCKFLKLKEKIKNYLCKLYYEESLTYKMLDVFALRSFNISCVGIRPMNIMNADRTIFPISEDWIRTKSLTPTAFCCHTYLKFGNTLRGFSSI